MIFPKFYPKFFPIFFLACFASFGQLVATNDILREIDEKVKTIDALDYGEVIWLKLQNFPMDSVFIWDYSKDKARKKIVFEGYNGALKVENSFYVQDAKLVYLKESTLVSILSGTVDLKKNGNKNENRSGDKAMDVWEEVDNTQNYFNKGVLIHRRESEDDQYLFSEKYLHAAGASLLDDYNTLLLLIKSNTIK